MAYKIITDIIPTLCAGYIVSVHSNIIMLTINPALYASSVDHVI